MQGDVSRSSRLRRPGVSERKQGEQQEGLEQGARVPGNSLSKVIREQGQAFDSSWA